MIIPKLPTLSPKAGLEQLIGITTVKLTYARPGVKGRTIFGDLVPYGKVWRTAANAGSYIGFDLPLTIEGIEVPAGEYGLLTIPGKDRWQVMLNKSLRTILTVPYDEQQDVLVATVPVEPHAFTETFTMAFEDLGTDTAMLRITWEDMCISLRVEAPSTTEQGMRNVDEALAEADVTPGVMHTCAAFCLLRGQRLPEALGWVRRSVELEPKFFTVRTLSLLLAANGLKDEAIATARRSAELSRAAGQDAFVRLNEEQVQAWEGKVVA